MKKDIHIIIGNSEDYHAVAVKWAAKLLGQESLIWDGIGPNDDDQMSFQPGLLGKSIHISGFDISSENIGTLWIRRPVKYRQIQNASPNTVRFIEDELNYSYLNLVAYLKRKAHFTICNTFRSEADCKSFQLEVASSIGLNVPETIITNNYNEVRAFAKKVGKIIYKPFNPYFWDDSVNGRHRVASTVIIENPELIQSESVELTPGIYQKYIDKEYELRVTVIGEKIFAAKIKKKEGGAFVDWRFHLDSRQAIVEKTELAADLEIKIFSLVKELGLKYGCLDFSVSDGVPYFLEINPTGQFLFIEHFVPEMPLLAAFTSFMLSGSASYQICDANLINIVNFQKTEDYSAMLKLRGSVVWENSRRSAL